MTLANLDNLRHHVDTFNWVNPEMLKGYINLIQAEVDNDYVERSKALYDTLIPLYISDWCMENQSDVEGYIKHFYLPLPLDTDGNPVQKDTRYKAIRKDSHGTDFVDVDNLYITVANNDMLFYHSTKWDFERIECDTQESIDADVELEPFEYCRKYSIDTSGFGCWHEIWIAMTKNLLERQRKLMGGDEV